MDQGLSLDNLGDVLEELHDVSPQWYKIGLQLKLSSNTMDKIKGEESDSNDQLLEMLKVWLKRVNPKPTWEALVVALTTRSVGRDQEANRLEEKYCKGKAVPKTPSDTPMRANKQQPKAKADPVIPKQQSQVVNTETALATSAQLQKSTEDAKKTTKRTSASTSHIENESTMPIQKGLKHHHQAVPEGQESRDSSSSLKRASTSTGSEEPSSKKPKEDDTREEELPSETLYQSCQDHMLKCKECRERLLKNGASVTAQTEDLHKQVNKPTKAVEEIQKTLECCQQTPPLTLQIRGLRDISDSKPCYSQPFYTSARGYKMRFRATTKPILNSHDLGGIRLSVEAMPGINDCYLAPIATCTGKVTYYLDFFDNIKWHLKLEGVPSVDLRLKDVPCYRDTPYEYGNKQLSKDCDCIHIHVIQVELDYRYLPWLDHCNINT